MNLNLKLMGSFYLWQVGDAALYLGLAPLFLNELAGANLHIQVTFDMLI